MRFRTYDSDTTETTNADASGSYAWRSQCFDSVSEMVAKGEEVVDKRCYEIDDPSWTGRDFTMGGSPQANMRLAFEAAFDAQQDEVDLIKELSKEFRKALHDLGNLGLKPQFKWNDRKGRVNVHRILAGEEKFRRGRINKMTDSGIVSIVVDIGQNADVSKEKGFMRAAAALAAVEFLEQTCGLRVNLWACEAGSDMFNNGIPNMETAWRLKAADRPLNLSVVTASMTTWFFRTTCFQSFFIPETPDTGLGRSVAPTIEQGKRMTGDENCHLITASLSGTVEECRNNAIKAAKQVIENAVKNTMVGYKDGFRWNNTDMYAETD